MVRLRLLSQARGLLKYALFQSHYGAIATSELAGRITRTLAGCFNPTMVRLRRGKMLRLRPEEFGFNPTMVRLRQISTPCEPLSSDCFNTTMVRLRLEDLERWGHRKTFQSHYGAIATRCDRCGRRRYGTFQSHYGAIATKILYSSFGKRAKFQSHYGAIATRHQSWG